MNNKIKLLIFVLISIFLIGCAENDKHISEEMKSRNKSQVFFEPTIEAQKNICAGIVGEWEVADFFSPDGGAPSQDSAIDYVNQGVEIRYEKDNLFMVYQGITYEFVYIRPLASKYLSSYYRFSGDVEKTICKGLTCEILFESGEKSIRLYANSEQEVFLMHGWDNVAEHACFVMERNEMFSADIEEWQYFSDKTEKLLDVCDLQARYVISKLMVEMVEEIGPYNQEIMDIDRDEENVVLLLDNKRLPLSGVEEVMGLSVSFMFDASTMCEDEVQAVLYTFGDEDDCVQIMERSDGKNYVRIYSGKYEDANIYELKTGM